MGTMRPCNGRCCSTVKPSFAMLSARLTVFGFTVAGGGAFGAGGVNMSAWIRSFSFGRYTISIPFS